MFLGNASASTLTPTLKRRQFLTGMGACLVGNVATSSTAALAAAPTRFLSLRHLNTDEQIDAAYMVNGRFDAEALEALDHFMRDWRTDEVISIDRNLFDMLYILSQQLPCSGPIGVISCYRSVATNDMLRRRGRGAAKNSLHTYGMAVDFRLPGVKLSAVRRHAMSLEAGGVGYYPKSHFVHIDTGPIRYW